jgi:uncharacterized protein (TIGR03435 family)
MCSAEREYNRQGTGTILSSFCDMKLTVLTLWMITVLSGFASAQRSGDIPPALVWNKLKANCPASLDWAALRGKVVVVSLTGEPVFPEDPVEWNAVPQNFQGEQVLFIRVVAGSEFLLDQALKQTAFQGCILFDSDLANLQNFRLPRFERTVVVDQLGVIAGYSRGGPDEDDVRAALNHQKAAGLSEVPPQPRPFDSDAGVDPVPSYEVHISPAPRGELRALGQGRPDLYIAKNQPLKLIILDLWNTPMARIAFPKKLDEGNYDVTAHIPVADRDLLLRLIRKAVEKQFGLLVEREERTQRIYVLEAFGNPSPQLQPAMSSEKSMSGGGQMSIIGTAQTMQDVAQAFEGLLNVPVVDGTGLKGKYNYSASSKLSEPEAAFDLAHQLGLKLTQADEQIEMLVVRKVQ